MLVPCLPPACPLAGPCRSVPAVACAFQSQELFSAVSWLGVSMQQTPNDAFVIADMLWRIRPDLVIELGTSGGGSAHFFAHVMEQ